MIQSHETSILTFKLTSKQRIRLVGTANIWVAVRSNVFLAAFLTQRPEDRATKQRRSCNVCRRRFPVLQPHFQAGRPCSCARRRNSIYGVEVDDIITQKTEKCNVTFFPSNTPEPRWQSAIHMESQPSSLMPQAYLLGVRIPFMETCRL